MTANNDTCPLPNTTACTLTQATKTVTGSHTYTDPGVYTVKLTVTDDDDDLDSGSSIFQFVVVFDPNGGFVTGGGTFDSPAGAYTADPSLTGQANFGFVSRYKKGANTPDGNTEFQFQAGDLNFHSASYDWLVVAGHQALYKGDGTINGGGDYGFLVSVVDEALTPSTDVDRFRIKIVDKDNGDAVVYDNQVSDDENAEATTDVEHGSIVIHKPKGKQATVPAVLRGDVDLDGSVAFSDFRILADSFGRNDVSEADIDGDGVVGFGDFLILSANYGQDVLAASVATPQQATALFADRVFSDGNDEKGDWWMENEDQDADTVLPRV